MRRPLCVMGCLLFTLVCTAADIVAWKVPLTHYAGAGMETPGIVRCKAVPEPSPFFKAGDELWDLKGVARMGEEPPDPPLEWVVWNASSGRLVVKGERNAIWQTYQNLGVERLPRQCRITAEVIEVPADGALLAANAVPTATLSWVTRSGQKFEVSRQGESDTMRMIGGATIGEDGSVVDIELDATCVVRDQPRLEILTAFVIMPGSTLWLARDFDGRNGLDLRVSARVELMDGTPAAEAYLIQKGNIAEPVEEDDHINMLKHQIGDKGWLVTKWMMPEEVAELFPGDRKVDPFVAVDVEKLRESLKVVWVETPEDLKPWFGTKVWDMRDLMRNMGINPADSTCFAGYDPVSRRIFLSSKDEKTLDEFEMLLTPCCILRPHLIAVTVEGKGQTRLLTRSGLKNRLSRFTTHHKVLRRLEIEPTIGEADLIDLRFEYRDKANTASRQSIKTEVTLQHGVPLTVLGAPTQAGKEPPLRVKAEVVEVLPWK